MELEINDKEAYEDGMPPNKKQKCYQWTDSSIYKPYINQLRKDTFNEFVFQEKFGDLNSDPVDLFEKFFEDILLLICKESKRCALQKNRHNFKVEPIDIKIFIGFLLFTGYHQLAREAILAYKRRFWYTSSKIYLF